MSGQQTSIEQIGFDDLEQLDLTILKLVVDGESIEVPVSDVWRLELTGNNAVKTHDRFPTLTLSNGDVWPVARIELAEEEVSVWPDESSAPLATPLDLLTSVYWSGPVEHGRIIKTVASSGEASAPVKPSSDVIRLQNGDRLEGEVQGFNAQQLNLKASLGDLEVPVPQIQRLEFNPDLIAEPDRAQVRFLVQMTNGARLSLTSLKLLESDQVELGFSSKQQWVCPRSLLQSIDFVSPAVQPLTWQPLTDLRQEAYFGDHLPIVLDGSNARGLLHIGQRCFPHGLGTRSQSSATFSLPPYAHRFCVHVGLQNPAIPLAHVTVQVWGRPAAGAEFQPILDRLILTPNHPAALLGPLDVSGMAELRLQTGFGENSDVGDSVNWCVPTLWSGK